MQHMKISVADTGLQVRVRPGNPDSEMGGGGGGGGPPTFSLRRGGGGGGGPWGGGGGGGGGGGAGCATAFGQGQIRPNRPGPSCLKGRLPTLSTGWISYEYNKNQKKIGQTERQQLQNRKSEKRIEQPEALISGQVPKKKVAVKEYYPLAIHSLWTWNSEK